MPAAPPEPQIVTLPSGLGLALKPMPQAQSVAVGIWVRAGGRYEMPERSGISHFVEHLLFKGTRRRTCEALKQRIEGVGGSLNGFTAEEFTCYMAKVPHRYAHRAIDVLADMVRRPTLTPQDTEKEREVILEEIRMYDDSPGQYVHDLFSQLLWPDHPLGMLLSGTIDTVRRITRADVVDYWRRMYQPRNTLVAVAGALGIEILLENQLGGHLVNQRFSFAPRCIRFEQGALPLRGRQPFVQQMHRCGRVTAQELAERRHFFRLRPQFSAQRQGQAHDNRLGGVLLHQPDDRGHILCCAALTFQRHQPLRRDPQGIAHRHADAPIADIQSDDPARHRRPHV